MKVYLVGGSVRDHLLGIKSKDKDYMVETDFETLKNYVSELGYTVLHEKPEYLTLRVRIPTGEVVDFACCRTEGDYDGRRPGSVQPTTVNNDLSRRDFTVNAMAMEVDSRTFEPTGEIIDPFGGQEDLALKVLKFVGKPENRLQEDGLRWLRAIRFTITKGLTLTLGTTLALEKVDPNVFDKVSVERIREELDKCFKHDTWRTLKMLSGLPNYWLKDGLWIRATIEDK